jgi:hypothetical protein
MANTTAPETGMELRDLLNDREFSSRKGKVRDFKLPFEALRRVTQVFAEHPQDVLQELVRIAVSCCGAESAGISLEEPNQAGEPTFRWVAISGTFEKYLEARTPRFFSPCGTCLDAGRPQLYRVTKPYYDFLGAFELQDYELLRSLADFVAIILRQRAIDEKARQLARSEASAARANAMAHHINNPLQSLTNILFLARNGGPDTQIHLEKACNELTALSGLVRKLLALEYADSTEPPTESQG